MTTTRSTAAILADLADYRAARSALVKGERVEDVWRDGRRMRLSEIGLDETERAIAALEREYAAAVAESEGRPRRAAIGTYF